MPQRNTFSPEAVDVLQVSGIENDYDPRITIRLRARGLEKKERATVTYAQMDGEEKWSGPCFIWRARLSSAHCKIYTVSLPKRVGRQLHKRVQHFILHLNPPSSLSPPSPLYSKILVTDLILLIKFFVEIEKKGRKKNRQFACIVHRKTATRPPGTRASNERGPADHCGSQLINFLCAVSARFAEICWPRCIDEPQLPSR